ncbi:tetratricopeptide repeat protein [Selenomonas sp. AE3005]|uniref:tetratricopeptide repeat protein n=1 Tax=Selenomonas sp. AE3005 TaxID=1485543 RepID=UPI0004845D35|nr:SEL1-like repeat protein [Selenomonas sp. AE3005]
MLDMAFQYSYEKKGWIKCTNTDYIKKDIERLPIVPLVEWEGYEDNNVNGLKVYCYKHDQEEEIKIMNDNRVISADGCIFEGLLGVKKCIEKSRREHHYSSLIPYRWRLFQRDIYSSINIAADVLDAQCLNRRRKYRWYNFAFSIDVIKRKCVISQYGYFHGNRKEWTELKEVDIPDVVVDNALNAMGESVKMVYGIKPSVLSQIKGKNKIKAYIERPFDINIVFLKNFFKRFTRDNGGDGFDKVFSYEEKDNYKIICKLLDIKPPKCLRKVYTYNPYSIVWYMLFKQWEIKDINYMQKFFCLDECIANIYLDKLYYNPSEKIVTSTEQETLNRWKALVFYCRWLMKRKGEKNMLKWLYCVSAEKQISEMQWDIILSFYRYHNNLSEEVKSRLLKDGLTGYVHDAISMEVTSLSEDWKHTRVRYDEKILAYECRVGEYEFRLVHNTRMLPKLGAIFNNCVATYRDRVINKKSVIVYLLNKSGYQACIEIQRECHIVQALGKYNRRLPNDINRICCFWANHHKLVIEPGKLKPLSDEELIDLANIEVEKIPYIKEVDEMNLNELLALDDSRIVDGYYLRLEEMISKSNKQNLSATYWMEFTNEKSKLSYVIPDGQRIYEAAFAGNTEAMRALGFMYYRGKGLKRDCDKAMQWFLKAADLGSKEAKLELERLKCLIKQLETERALAILYALNNLGDGWQGAWAY